MREEPTLTRFLEGLERAAAEAARIGRKPETGERFGLAVSGGADSLALLLLAHRSLPGRIMAATFDHGFRPESAAEAAHVASICARLGVPHTTLLPGCTLSEPDIEDSRRRHPGGLQALARTWRYRALDRWCRANGLIWLLTAHHADDQAETVLMRLSRGAGVRGLSGIRRALSAAMAYHEGRILDEMDVGPAVVGRPLLDFSKVALSTIVDQAGLEPVVDPSNVDPRFDRTRARALLADTEWLDPRRLAHVADVMRETDLALQWMTTELGKTRLRRDDNDDFLLRPDGLPPALLRRLCEDAIYFTHEIATADGSEPSLRGAELTTLIDRLRNGLNATIGPVLAIPGAEWRFTSAPPRRAPNAT